MGDNHLISEQQRIINRAMKKISVQAYKQCKKDLLSVINKRVAELDEQDAESHIWYGKFKTLIKEL